MTGNQLPVLCLRVNTAGLVQHTGSSKPLSTEDYSRTWRHVPPISPHGTLCAYVLWVCTFTHTN